MKIQVGNQHKNKEDMSLDERVDYLATENEKLRAEVERLKTIEYIYRERFEESPISLWDKDYSEIRKYIDSLKEKGVTDFKKYFNEHPEELEHCATLIKVTDVNNTTVRMYGAEDKEDFKRNLHKIFCDETWNCFREEVLYVADSKNKREAETITKRFNDEENNILVKWSIPQQYEGIPYSRILFSIVDLTKQKQAEKEAKLMQMKLIHANKMTALGTLVSGVAHEINNPNSYIQSNAVLLAEVWNDVILVLTEHYQKNGDFFLGGLRFSELREYMPKLLNGIKDGSERIRNIVDNLRDFVRPERININEQVDINKVISASKTILDCHIRQYTNNFKVVSKGSLPLLKGNSQQIEQVIINLIMNSLQALPVRNCAVSLSAYHNENKGQVVVQVKDEGIGMPREIIDRITEPFFTTKADSGGTGLGLSISYAIIKDHSGSLEFESEPGKGTIVTVKLPVYEGAGIAVT